MLICVLPLPYNLVMSRLLDSTLLLVEFLDIDDDWVISAAHNVIK